MNTKHPHTGYRVSHLIVLLLGWAFVSILVAICLLASAPAKAAQDESAGGRFDRCRVLGNVAYDAAMARDAGLPEARAMVDLGYMDAGAPALIHFVYHDPSAANVRPDDLLPMSFRVCMENLK